MAGGSYLVARRIRMHIEVWDRTSLQEQEDIIGRDKKEGAPLGQAKEFDALDFARKGPDGEPAIPVNAHVRLAHESQLGGIRILRRGYNFTDGSDGVGHLDAGLFFLAYMRDPQKQFVPDAAGARQGRRAQRVHRAQRVGRLRVPARPEGRAALGPGALRLTVVPRGYWLTRTVRQPGRTVALTSVASPMTSPSIWTGTGRSVRTRISLHALWSRVG